MGIKKLFNRYRELPSFKERCSKLASDLVNGKAAGNIIDFDEIDKALQKILCENGHIKNYMDRNKSINSTDSVDQRDEVTLYCREIHDDVMKQIEDILSKRNLKLVQDGDDLKIRRE